MPAPDADPHAFRKVIEDVIHLVERSPDKGRPVPPQGPPLKWPPQGLDYEARTKRGGYASAATALKAMIAAAL